MNMSKATTAGVLWAILTLGAANAAGQTADERWQFGSAPSFSSGKYGTDTRTDVLYTPITARRLFDDGDLTLVFPFTCVWGNAVTVINGSPVRTERGGNNVSTTDATGARSGADSTRGSRAGTSSGTARGAGSAAVGSSTDAPAEEAAGCGMGDIIARGRYYILDERGILPTVAIRAHVKIPTASAERGLGTGRPDEGVAIEVSRSFGAGTLAMVDGGYTVIGKPTDVDYNNTWWYDVGIGQDIAKGLVNVSLFFEEYGAIVPGFENARQLLGVVSFKGANGWRLQLAGELGLSDGAPDGGVTFGASRRF
jgi:hypothetical protein